MIERKRKILSAEKKLEKEVTIVTALSDIDERTKVLQLTSALNRRQKNLISSTSQRKKSSETFIYLNL